MKLKFVLVMILLGWQANIFASSSKAGHGRSFLGLFSQKRLYLSRSNGFQTNSRFCAWRYPKSPDQRYYYTQITCAPGSEGNCSNNHQFSLKPISGEGPAIPVDVYYKPNARSSWQKVEYHRMIPNDQSLSRSCSDARNRKALKVEIPLTAINLDAIKPGRYHLGLNIQMKSWENPSAILQSKRVDAFMTIRERVRISGMKDIDLQWSPGQNDTLQTDNRHCVFVSGGGDYRVAVTSENNPSNLYLSDNREKIPYQLGYQNKNRRIEWIDQPGQLRKVFQGSHSKSCIGTGYNANLIFKSKIPEDTLSGKYSDRITITVQAQ
ncbi:MAG: hypothetical protein ACR2PX_16540 [Endozoicomonas sp.]|uniref:hypothetical protein n=1 Tax=Endozoicomonas sp. TaxID=1892382 RepID=UPI003D9B73D5